MNKTIVREPKQKRSIEKKNKIIDAGFQLFCEKGYHNTTTAEIAKTAGVSTGILYNYFSDKKEIFLICISNYGRLIAEPMFALFNEIDPTLDLANTLTLLIDRLVESHYVTKDAHEEMESMSHADKEVALIFIEFENEICHKLTQMIINLGMNTSNLHEKVHLAYHLVENYCHEVVYHKHDCLDYSIMKQLVIESIVYLMQ